jgi:hypothetical protein
MLRKSKLIFFCLFVSAVCVHAQVKISSPVSILGFGHIVDENHTFMQSLGSTKASFHAGNFVNVANPAALAHLKTTVFSGGLHAERTKLSQGNATSKVWTGNIGYLSLAMPLQNQINAIFDRKEPKIKWGLNISLRPYSIVGFDFNDVDTQDPDLIQRSFSGDGSTYIVSVSNGWKYKNLSFGIMTGYLFGSTDLNRTATFSIAEPGSGYSYQTIEAERKNYRAFVWNSGLMYDIIFGEIERADGSKGDPNKYLTLGLTYHSDWSMRSETDQSILRQNLNLATVIQTDTLSAINDLQADATLPGVFNFGLSYVYKTTWRAGLNYEANQWSNFRNGTKSETQAVKNAFKFSGGVAYTPNATSITSFFDRVTYSIGFHYGKDPRVLNGNQLENIGMKVGFALPFVGQRQVSYLNLNFGIGKLGVSNGYNENYYSFGLGYTLSDNQWFVKRKYD